MVKIKNKRTEQTFKIVKVKSIQKRRQEKKNALPKKKSYV